MKAEPRQRLLDTAATLFYERGIPNVGINELVDQAGVARMTLYHHFASKDELVTATLARRGESRRADLQSRLSKCRSPQAKVRALFELIEAAYRGKRYRGCAFINAALETADPASSVHAEVAKHKAWVRDAMRCVAHEAGARHPGRLAQQLVMLWDGALVESYIQQSPRLAAVAREAAETLLAAATQATR